jgi:hypothetical protein
MSDLPHDLEIEKRAQSDIERRRCMREGTSGATYEYRVSCSCGFNGPWRLARKTANRDSDRHLERMAHGE